MTVIDINTAREGYDAQKAERDKLQNEIDWLIVRKTEIETCANSIHDVTEIFKDCIWFGKVSSLILELRTMEKITADELDKKENEMLEKFYG